MSRKPLILLFFVFVIIGITFYQERKTERTLEALRDLSSPRALVIRDGAGKENRGAGGGARGYPDPERGRPRSGGCHCDLVRRTCAWMSLS